MKQLSKRLALLCFLYLIPSFSFSNLFPKILHTLETGLALPFDILHNISLWFQLFCYILFHRVLHHPLLFSGELFTSPILFFHWALSFFRKQPMFYYGYVLQCVNPETYSTPTYLPWKFSYFMSISLVKTGHISQWMLLTQTTYLFSLSHMALTSEIEGVGSTGSRSLVFTPVWIWLYSMPDEEFNRGQVKFPEPAAVESSKLQIIIWSTSHN